MMSNDIVLPGSLKTTDFRVNSEIDRRALACVGRYDGLRVHEFWSDAFIRQHPDVSLEERKLTRNNSVYTIHLVQGLWTSVPAQLVVVDSSSLRPGQPIRKVNLDLAPCTLISDCDMSNLSTLIRIT